MDLCVRRWNLDTLEEDRKPAVVNSWLFFLNRVSHLLSFFCHFNISRLIIAFTETKLIIKKKPNLQTYHHHHRLERGMGKRMER